jgi:thioredoxin 1
MSEIQGSNKPIGRVAVVAILIAAVVGVIALKERGEPGPHGDADNGGAGVIASGGDRPLLVDFGSDTCVPCKMMDPILEELRTEYAEELKVVFIDVKMEREAAERNGIRVIPTQIFYSAEGKELFRHEGFYSKEEILEKWKELGVDLGREGPAGPNREATSLHRPLPGARGRDRHATAAVSRGSRIHRPGDRTAAFLR